MITTYKPEFIINESGKKTKVLLSYKEYIKLLQTIEDLQDSKLIEQTKNEPEISLSKYMQSRSFV